VLAWSHLRASPPAGGDQRLALTCSRFGEQRLPARRLAWASPRGIPAEIEVIVSGGPGPRKWRSPAGQLTHTRKKEALGIGHDRRPTAYSGPGADCAIGIWWLLTLMPRMELEYLAIEAKADLWRASCWRCIMLLGLLAEWVRFTAVGCW
jgi:hypothetical protein